MLRCREEGLPRADYEEVTYPHPYIELWVACRRLSPSSPEEKGGEDFLLLPEPGKGYLDQDADLLLAFEVCEEFREEEARAEEARMRAREAARSLHMTL